MRTRGIEVELESEKGMVQFREGKWNIEGYDVENEKIALALSGNRGRGLGVLLVALEENCPQGDIESANLPDLQEAVDILAYHPSRETSFVRRGVELSGKCPALHYYMSYSPYFRDRDFAATNGKGFSLLAWRRLSKEKHLRVFNSLAVRKDVPVEIADLWSGSSNQDLRLAICSNYNLSISAMHKVIDRGIDLEIVRLGFNSKANEEILMRIAKINSWDIWKWVAGAPHFTTPLLTRFCLEGSVACRMALAIKSDKLEQSIYQILARDVSLRIRIKLAGNPGIGQKVIQILLLDKVPLVREVLQYNRAMRNT